MRYSFDVVATFNETIEVEAKDLETARQKAEKEMRRLIYDEIDGEIQAHHEDDNKN